ncbi:MAG: helix-turn-helix transcriptional regulator [Spirulinaceae cyanobacterium]
MSGNKRRGGYLATAEGVKKLKEAKRIKKYTYEQIAEEAKETEDKVKRLFNPQWGNGKYKVGEEAVQAICNVLNLKPEEIVSDWYPLEITSDESQVITINQKKTYWRSGVVLANEGNLALVKADKEDKIIKIRVSGKTNTRRNLLTAIRSQFDYIHETIPGIVPVEKVPLIEHPEIILDYQELLGLEAMGETDYPIGKLRKRIPLKQLLDGIESLGNRPQTL